MPLGIDELFNEFESGDGVGLVERIATPRDWSSSKFVELEGIAAAELGFIEGYPIVAFVTESFGGGRADVDDFDFSKLIGFEIQIGAEIEMELA